MAQPRIDISQLSLPELQDLYEQLKAELESFSRQMLALQETAGRFASTGQALEELKGRQQGQPVLLPMTESLYVPGTMESVDNVMLEIGTGYYIEVSDRRCLVFHSFQPIFRF
jgi:prefoldin alpha subunit